MWIRSQDKTTLINTDKIFFKKCIDKTKSERKLLVIPHDEKLLDDDEFIKDIDQQYCQIWRTFYGKKYEFNDNLGAYSTKEKAMKVLDYLIIHCIQTGKKEFETMIFQMPQDNEVK